MLQVLNLCPEFLGRSFSRRSTIFPSHFHSRSLRICPESFKTSFLKGPALCSSRYDARCFSSGARVSATTVSMDSEASWESSSNGCCSQTPAEDSAYDDSSQAADKNPLSSCNGETQKLGVDDRRDVTSFTDTLLTIPQQSGPSTPDNLGDASEGGRCDCSASGGESREGEEGFRKRLRREENLIRNSAENGVDKRIAAAWEHWRKLGEPKMHVAPMVDQSELPFRMLCRKYGATGAYTPMLHSRLFARDVKYRKEFSTCPEDRPLFVQFCANNPDTLLEAARLVEQHCDYVDINLGCPQRIAKKGNYGAFLMDNLPLIKSLVSNLASNLAVPVSCKIRVFPDLEDTLAYARMLEEAGCSLLAVHGRTRDQKNGKLVRADWEAIKAVKKALRIPVLGNGNIRWLEDVHDCIAFTGVDGVMSAESLLENPALYAGYRMSHLVEDTNSEEASGVTACHNGEPRMEQPQTRKMDERDLMLEYLHLCEQYPVPMRMVRGHTHKILGNFWFKRNPDIREELNKQHVLTVEWLKAMVHRLMARPPFKGSSPLEAVSDAVSAPMEQQELTSAAVTREALPLCSHSQEAITVS